MLVKSSLALLWDMIVTDRVPGRLYFGSKACTIIHLEVKS